MVVQQTQPRRKPLHAKFGCGWPAQALKRFNQIYDMVLEDRCAHPGFIKYYMRHQTEQHKETMKVPEPPVEARNDLFLSLNVTGASTACWMTQQQSQSSSESTQAESAAGR